MSDLVLLCRHARRDHEAALAAALSNPGGQPEELDELAAVIEAMTDALAHDNVRVVTILHAPSTIATRHATWLAGELARHGAGCDRPAEAVEALRPECFMTWRSAEPAKDLARTIVEKLRAVPKERQQPDGAVLVVGHMPQLCWLGPQLIANRRVTRWATDGPPPPLALKNGEIAAIALTDDRRGPTRGRLEWTVAPDDTKAIDDLREKIKSKMEIAKLLGGFMTLVLGGVLLAPGRLTELSRGGDRWAVYVAAVAFLIAIGLYLRTMYAYDSLLMPRRFWGETSPGTRQPRWLVRRPPSSASWILYQNMLHIWNFLFTPATVAVGIGLVMLAYASLEPGWVEGGLSAFALAVVALYAGWRRPRLGSQD